jgi:hypothetical protein
MGKFSDLKRMNKVTDFATSAAKRGGAFETSCSPEQILAWLKATRIQVVDESPTALSVNPIYKHGNVGSEVISAQVSAGSKLPTLVTIEVQLNAQPGSVNPNAIPPIFGLLSQVSKVDPTWQPV